MRRGPLTAFLVLVPLQAVAEAPAPVTTMDVAPTTLELKPNVPGLFFVANHGARAVTVQIEAMDWRQEQGRDVLAPSREFLTSPPMARIAPGVRQSVRVMARPGAGGEHAYRLLVSELPDVGDAATGVRVLLQFSVPVFVGHDPGVAPQLAWRLQGGGLSATNRGPQTVKLEGLQVGGTPWRDSLVYLLPGVSRDFGAAAGPVRVRAHDGRSGSDLAADVVP